CSHVETIPPHSYFVICHSSFSCGSQVEIVPQPLVLRHSSLSRGSQVEIVPHPLVLRPSYFVLFSIPFCRRGFQVQVAPPIADSRFACSQVETIPYFRPMRKLKLEELGRATLEEFRGSEKLPVTIVLDNVRSMNNVGSAFRTSDAF